MEMLLTQHQQISDDVVVLYVIIIDHMKALVFATMAIHYHNSCAADQLANIVATADCLVVQTTMQVVQSRLASDQCHSSCMYLPRDNSYQFGTTAGCSLLCALRSGWPPG